MKNERGETVVTMHLIVNTWHWSRNSFGHVNACTVYIIYSLGSYILRLPDADAIIPCHVVGI